MKNKVNKIISDKKFKNEQVRQKKKKKLDKKKNESEKKKNKLNAKKKRLDRNIEWSIYDETVL